MVLILLCKQGLNSVFGFFITAFANVGVAKVSIFIYEIQRGPVTILVSPPCRAVVILRNGILDSKIFYGSLKICEVFFKGKFGVMISDDDKPLIAIFFVPFLQRRNH